MMQRHQIPVVDTLEFVLLTSTVDAAHTHWSAAHRYHEEPDPARPTSSRGNPGSEAVAVSGDYGGLGHARVVRCRGTP